MKWILSFKGDVTRNDFKSKLCRLSNKSIELTQELIDGQLVINLIPLHQP